MINRTPTESRTYHSKDTAEQFYVVGIHGAIEQHEIAHQALTQALIGAGNTGAATHLLDLSALTLPLYNPDPPESRYAVVVMRCISQADAVLLTTSSRHDSYSTQLKNALEYCGPDEFNGTPVGLLGVARKSEPTPALNQLRTICTTLGAQVLTTQVGIATEATCEDDELPHDRVTNLRTLGQQVVEWISPKWSRAGSLHDF
ncbi:NADPH-dependent FMN reductase [Haladaptatus pallidirubidus]|uniref:NADPH-dependent FMN reductase n=1 Tax=Haladaptatus pallidirubidus TaxID=1008152 RepID=A0AAV3UQ85_9EURY|nr:NAD(P)H-dependent oxidoreductase [Haladaptatus pallidirubidus]